MLINDPRQTADERSVFCETETTAQNIFFCLFCDKRLPPPVKHLIWHHSIECTFHEETAFADSDGLFSWNGIEKLEKIAVKIGESHLTEKIRLEGPVRQQSAQNVKYSKVFLKAWERTKELEPGWVASERGIISADKTLIQPKRRLHVDRYAG